MVLEELKLTNFRNFKNFQQGFNKKTILIIGPNASGKSNLLEAIGFLAFGSSPKASQDNQVISWGERNALISAQIKNSQKISHQLSILLKPDRKTLSIDGKFQTLPKFIGRFFAVLFSPSDLGLLSGSPRRRRRFLDQTLSLLEFEYLSHLTEFKKVLKSRNWLLRKGNTQTSELSFWNQTFVKTATLVVIKRAQVLNLINQQFAQKGSGLFLEYVPSPRWLLKFFLKGDLEKIDRAQIETYLNQALLRVFAKELTLGFSLFGPQRDDFKIRSTHQEKLDLGVFGSRGEQRMAILRLKKAQLKLIEEKKGEKAVFLLDDVFSELDAKNQGEIIKILEDHQTFITSTTHLPIFQNLENCQVVNLG